MGSVEVILLKAVEQVGAEGAIVHVKSGFARNYLIPRGLALPATVAHQKRLEELRHQQQAKRERIKRQADALKQKLESRSLTVKLALGAEDKPFGAITAHDIVQTLAQEGIKVDRHAVHLEDPIKTLGIYEVPVRLHPEVTATLKLWVVKE